MPHTRRHPWQVGLGALAVAAVAAGIWYLVYRVRKVRRRGQRLGGGIDSMTGPEFEQYVAGLMRRTGFRAVQVTGQAADLGADITAATPDGRRVVVQCKRYSGSVGSPHVQRLNGTAWVRSVASPSARWRLASMSTISDARPDSSSAYANVAPTLPTPTTATRVGWAGVVVTRGAYVAGQRPRGVPRSGTIRP